MESSLRHSVSVSSRISALDVGQLDKINAIPNKTTNNVLLDGLCLEDQLYLDTLMDDESTDTDSNYDNSGSPWSPPMAERPMTLNMSGQKRMKMKMKPQYAITLSLEDISYIRPSWGMSKGIKRIDANKQKTKKMAAKDKVSAIKIDELEKGSEGDESKEKKPLVNPYHLLLISLMVIVVSLIVLSYLVDVGRLRGRTQKYRIELYPKQRSFKVFKQKGGVLLRHRSLKVNYGRGIPSNLKHEDCTCEMYDAERRKYFRRHKLIEIMDEQTVAPHEREDCFACFNWAQRTNMQMFVNRSYYNNLMNHQHSGMLEDDLAITCYDIKWQSYDTLETPLVDCFEMGDEQWFGLGDIQTPLWPLDKFDQDEFAPLTTNLSAEFQDQYLPLGFLPLAQSPRDPSKSINFGSQVDFSLLTSNGFSIGNLRTDFQPVIKISSSKREICLSVVCADKCSQLWTRRHDETDKFRFQNNLLEYSICSTSSWRLLSLRLIDERTQSLLNRIENKNLSLRANQAETHGLNLNAVRQTEVEITRSVTSNQIEGVHNQVTSVSPQRVGNSNKQTREAIGLIERTLFKTNHIETLDGQTVRQHVDKIVKLNLKTPILVLDTRWQTYVGSFKLNAALFPKAKLLFEILHNKGFKIVMTVKPYIDVSVGIAGLKQLLDNKRIVTGQYESDLQAVAASTGRDNMISVAPQRYYLSSTGINTFMRLEAQPELARQNLTSTVVRRKSFFAFKNETVFFKDELEQQLAPASRKPYLFDCKESHSGHCVLIDLLSATTRAWVIELIKRSNFLSQEADGILLSGAHPDSQHWDAHFRRAMFELVDELSYRENLFVVPQWTTNFNFVQLAPRRRDWDGLRSIVKSVLNLGIQGFALIHPGSVWGDIRPTRNQNKLNEVPDSPTRRQPPISLDGQQSDEQRDEELIMRWLQVAIFLPILQFDDLAPIERFQIQEQVQTLIRVRKTFVVPELKKNLPFTPLVYRDFAEFKSARPPNQQQLAALRYTWNNNVPVGDHSPGGSGWLANEAIGQQFMIGADLLVAPVLVEGQRQKDIFLPAGIWHDELRNVNTRGGKWLRNYPIELNEVAWFTRAKR